MTKRNPLPSTEYLRSLFSYNPQTGELRWKVKRGGMQIGDIAGAQRGEGGYLQVSIDRKLYRVHLVIWKIVTGSEPVAQIDHRNTIKNHNQWDNLREATKSLNQANIGLTVANTTGRKNVFWYKAYQKWAVQVWKDGIAYFGGYHSSVEDASAAADVLRIKLFGKFARAS